MLYENYLNDVPILDYCINFIFVILFTAQGHARNTRGPGPARLGHGEA